MFRIFKGTEFEFRNRYLIHVMIFFAGFGVPWDRLLLAQNGFLTWGVLAIYPQEHRWMSIDASTLTVTALGLFFAGAGALLCTWGTAYLGAEVVKDSAMHGGGVVADGPYRHVRNPLYLGTGLMIAAISFAMPVTGAVFAIVLIAIFQLRLILGEETFLSAKLGQPYSEYLRTVPRLFPRLRTNLSQARGQPRWGRAVLAEISPIGVFVILAGLSWRYENMLMIKAFVICFGISLVVRALMPAENTASAPSL